MDDSPMSQPRRKSGGGTEVPVAVVSGVICLGLGIAGGYVVAGLLQEPPKKNSNEDPAALAAAAAGVKAGPPAGPGGSKGGGPPGGGPPGGGKGGFGAPSPKMQLTQLVAKLDVLTARPLTVQLTPEEKKQAAKILAGLEDKDNLTDAEAQQMLDALLKLVEGQKDVLAAAGYRWPGAPLTGGPPGQPPNPFKTGDAAEHLKSLQTTLGK